MITQNDIELRIEYLESQGASIETIRLYEALGLLLIKYNGIGAPSQELLAKKAGIGKNTVPRCLSLLESHDYIYSSRATPSVVKDLLFPKGPRDPSHTGSIFYRLILRPAPLFDVSDEMSEIAFKPTQSKD